jgi:hypothetical protein
VLILLQLGPSNLKSKFLSSLAVAGGAVPRRPPPYAAARSRPPPLPRALVASPGRTRVPGPWTRGARGEATAPWTRARRLSAGDVREAIGPWRRARGAWLLETRARRLAPGDAREETPWPPI